MLSGIGPACGQSVGEPIPLAPPPAPTPSAAAPAPLGPASVFPADRKAAPLVHASPVLDIDQLRNLDPESTGVLEAKAGGLGVGLWAGTPRAQVTRLIPELPVGAPSPAQRDLTRRLLLSVANAPQNIGTGGTGAGRSLTALRVEKLAALGGVADLAALVSVAPSILADEGAARAWVDTVLLEAVDTLDCGEIPRLVQTFDTPYWQKLLVFCQIRTGDAAAAALGAAVLREQGIKDEVFFGLVERLTGGPDVPIKSLPDPAALHIAMARVAGKRLPADALPAKPASGDIAPARLAAIARSAPVARTSPAESLIQVTAAERAALTGALPAAAVADAYAAFPSKPAEIAGAPALIERERTTRARALLYQAIIAAKTPAERTDRLRRALELTDPAAAVGPLGGVWLALLNDDTATTDRASLASAAARAWFAAGRAEAARPWYALLRQGTTPEAVRAAVSLWPLAAVVEGMPGGESGTDPIGLDRWLSAALEDPTIKDTAARRYRLGGLLGLLEALGEPVDDDAWLRVLGPGGRSTVEMPSPALWRRLQAAGAAGHVGEVVLLSLVMLGEAGPQGVPPLIVATVVDNLRRVGLEAEARALAREAAVALIDNRPTP